MTAQSQVPKLYQSVIEDVINNVREAFMDEGVDESVLTELKQIWQHKLTQSKVIDIESTVAPPSAQLLAGPYAALQHHPESVTSGRIVMESKPDRPPAVPVSTVPIFTTLSRPGQELSDAASMAYSSIIQSALVQTPNGPVHITPQPAHTGPAPNRQAMIAAANAAQPQYLFASPGSVGPVIIPHSQAIRLQPPCTDPQGRGTLPQVDGPLEDVFSSTDNIPEKDLATSASDPNLDLDSMKESLVAYEVSAPNSTNNELNKFPTTSLSQCPKDFLRRGLLQLQSGKHIRGKLLQNPKKRPVKIVFQVDGGGDSSSDDDNDDEDDNEMGDDDSSDKDPDDEDVPGVEDEPLNSEDDVSDNDPEELFDTENVVVCQYDKISRVRNKWKFYLKDGIMNIAGKDYVFLKASGEADW
jgi:transcription initiation factor TFIIA large subunit